jgi:hypothetical protein
VIAKAWRYGPAIEADVRRQGEQTDAEGRDAKELGQGRYSL